MKRSIVYSLWVAIFVLFGGCTSVHKNNKATQLLQSLMPQYPVYLHITGVTGVTPSQKKVIIQTLQQKLPKGYILGNIGLAFSIHVRHTAKDLIYTWTFQRSNFSHTETSYRILNSPLTPSVLTQATFEMLADILPYFSPTAKELIPTSSKQVTWYFDKAIGEGAQWLQHQFEQVLQKNHFVIVPDKKQAMVTVNVRVTNTPTVGTGHHIYILWQVAFTHSKVSAKIEQSNTILGSWDTLVHKVGNQIASSAFQGLMKKLATEFRKEKIVPSPPSTKLSKK